MCAHASLWDLRPAAPPEHRIVLVGVLGAQGVAAAVNGEVVPRAQHSAHRLAEGDRVEVIRAVGGG